MKKFEIPTIYQSGLIQGIKKQRKLEDPRKKDFSPSTINLGAIEFIFARHFGFCYGVENAIELSYKALKENPGKRIYLLSQMIHNPHVNNDLQENGINFIQDTYGNEIIPWSNIKKEDVVIIPAFGTTIDIENKLQKLGVDIQKYNTTCPFVEKVWNTSKKLGDKDFTIIIHGKYGHEETRATFSHSMQYAPSIIVKDINESKKLAEAIEGKMSREEFFSYFKNKHSEGFDPDIHLKKVGVINQTTMLASETQEISDYFKNTMISFFGEDNYKEHFADTRDTLCYATNDNQKSTLELLKEKANMALVIGGYNSSNTTHLVELCQQNFPTYFISSESKILSSNKIEHFNIHTKKEEISSFKEPLGGKKMKIIITSGASCPDSIMEEVIDKIISFYPSEQIKNKNTITL